jgi:hypothetical protein
MVVGSIERVRRVNTARDKANSPRVGLFLLDSETGSE